MPFSLAEVESSAQGTTRLIAVRGEVDLSSVGRIARAVELALEQRPETLVLDMDGVTFCDSSGVQLVVRSHHRAADRRCRLVVVRPRGAAWRPFEICQIDREVQFVDAGQPTWTPTPSAPIRVPAPDLA